MTEKVPLSTILKLNAATQIEYEVKLKAESDPKLKARIEAQENAEKHLEKINKILKKVAHLVSTEDGSEIEYEVHSEVKLQKPGKKRGAKQIVCFTNPHTQERVEVEWSTKIEAPTDPLAQWIETFGITEVAQWAEVTGDEE